MAVIIIDDAQQADRMRRGSRVGKGGVSARDTGEGQQILTADNTERLYIESTRIWRSSSRICPWIRAPCTATYTRGGAGGLLLRNAFTTLNPSFWDDPHKKGQMDVLYLDESGTGGE